MCKPSFETTLERLLEDRECYTSHIWVHVGEVTRKYGWKIHLSCVPLQLNRITLAVARLRDTGLLKFQFKVAKSLEIAVALNEGTLGLSAVGKCLTIYPDSDRDLLAIANALKHICNDQGPDIVEDFKIFHGVYTRFGSFKPDLKRNALGITEAYIDFPDGTTSTDLYSYSRTLELTGLHPDLRTVSEETRDRRLPLSAGDTQGAYEIIEVISQSIKGAVYIAKFHKAYSDQRFVLKEACKGVQSNLVGEDARNRLKHDFEVGQKLNENHFGPQYIDLFEKNDRVFLVSLYQRHSTFFDQIEKADTLGKRATLILRALRTIADLHTIGYYHCDICPQNIWFTDAKCLVVDFETCVDCNEKGRVTSGGTVGYSSFGNVPVEEADVYSAACIILKCIIGLTVDEIIEKFRYSSELFQLQWPDGQATLEGVIFDIVNVHNCEIRPSLMQLALALGSIEQYGLQLLSYRNEPPALESGYNRSYRSVENQCWFSLDANDEQSLVTSTDVYSGYAGILYTFVSSGVIKEHMLEDSKKKLIVFSSNAILDDLQNSEFDDIVGLYFGQSGRLLTTLKLRKVGIGYPRSADVLHILYRILSIKPHWFDVTHGSAGLVMALSQCLDEDLFFEFEVSAGRAIIEKHVKYLCYCQTDDGLWLAPSGAVGMSGETYFGFAHGAAGIAYSLLYASTLGISKDQCIQACKKTLLSLNLNAIRENINGQTVADWPIDTNAKSAAPRWWCHGSAGVLAFLSEWLRLYSNYKPSIFTTLRSEAEAGLVSIDKSSNISLCHGEAGRLLYLYERYHFDKSEICGDMMVKVRSRIAKRRLGYGDECFWLAEKGSAETFSLMNGNGGICLSELNCESTVPVRLPGCRNLRGL